MIVVISYLRNIERNTNQIESNTKFLNQLQDFFAKRGMDTTLTNPSIAHDSLSPEKALRRDELVKLGKNIGLDSIQAKELEALLKEDAQDDLIKGIVGILAFTLIIFAVASFVNALTKK